MVDTSWSFLRQLVVGFTLLLAAFSSTYAEHGERTSDISRSVCMLGKSTAASHFRSLTGRVNSRVETLTNCTSVLSRHRQFDGTRLYTPRRLNAQAAGPRPTHNNVLSEHSNHQKGFQGHSSPASSSNIKRGSPKQLSDSDVISRLPKVGMFYHIPKTGGSSIREAMTPEYEKRFPWGATFSYPMCGVKRASTFHLTPDDMAKCGVPPLPGHSLCVVRDPIARFASEVRWRASFRNGWLGDDPLLFAARMAMECEAARRYIKADVFCHCQPQVNYLYRGAAQRAEGEEEAAKKKSASQMVSSHTSTLTSADAVSVTRKEEQARETALTRAGVEGVNTTKSPPLTPACDYVLADPSAHTRLLRHLLPRKLPPERVNVSENKTDTAMQWRGLNEREKAWVRSFYARDFADQIIALALQGAVLRHDKSSGKYAEIKGLRRGAEQPRVEGKRDGPKTIPARGTPGLERNVKGRHM